MAKEAAIFSKHMNTLSLCLLHQWRQRAFSAAGKLCTKLRNHLHYITLETLCFLCAYYNMWMYEKILAHLLKTTCEDRHLTRGAQPPNAFLCNSQSIIYKSAKLFLFFSAWNSGPLDCGPLDFAHPIVTPLNLHHSITQLSSSQCQHIVLIQYQE